MTAKQRNQFSDPIDEIIAKSVRELNNPTLNNMVFRKIVQKYGLITAEKACKNLVMDYYFQSEAINPAKTRAHRSTAAEPSVVSPSKKEWEDDLILVKDDILMKYFSFTKINTRQPNRNRR